MVQHHIQAQHVRTTGNLIGNRQVAEHGVREIHPESDTAAAVGDQETVIAGLFHLQTGNVSAEEITDPQILGGNGGVFHHVQVAVGIALIGREVDTGKNLSLFLDSGHQGGAVIPAVVEAFQVKGNGGLHTAEIPQNISVLVPCDFLMKGTQGVVFIHVGVGHPAGRKGLIDDALITFLSEIGDELFRTVKLMGISRTNTLVQQCLIVIHQPDFVVQRPLNGQFVAIFQQKSISPVVGTGQLTGGGVEVNCYGFPGQITQILGHLDTFRILDFQNQVAEVKQSNKGVGRTVEFTEIAMGHIELMELAQPFLAVGKDFRLIQQFTGNQGNIGSHNGNVGVIGPHIPLDDGPAGVENTVLHPPLQIVGDLITAVQQHPQQFLTVEVGPVPVRLIHFLQVFFQKVRPDAIGVPAGVDILQGDHPVQNVIGPLPVAGFVPPQQIVGIAERTPNIMDHAVRQLAVISVQTTVGSGHADKGIVGFFTLTHVLIVKSFFNRILLVNHGKSSFPAQGVHLRPDDNLDGRKSTLRVHSRVSAV